MATEHCQDLWNLPQVLAFFCRGAIFTIFYGIIARPDSPFSYPQNFRKTKLLSHDPPTFYPQFLPIHLPQHLVSLPWKMIMWKQNIEFFLLCPQCYPHCPQGLSTDLSRINTPVIHLVIHISGIRALCIFSGGYGMIALTKDDDKNGTDSLAERKKNRLSLSREVSLIPGQSPGADTVRIR